MLTKNQKIDISRFIARIRKDCDTKKVVNITLKKGGISLAQLNTLLGSGYSAKQNGNSIIIAKVNGPLAKFIAR